MRFIKITSLLLFFCLSANVNAQIGLQLGYSNVGTNFEFDENFTAFAPSYVVGLDYWFRLKEQRVEFYPQLSYLFSGTETYNNNFGSGEEVEQSISMPAIKLNVRFYPMDFKGDCNCPTFSKQGDTFQKGFFIFASAGYNFLQKTTNSAFASSSDNSESLFSYGLGAGLDIGLSDFVTISPFVSYERTASKGTWDLHPCDLCDKVEDVSFLSPLTVGIHTEFRWKKY